MKKKNIRKIKKSIKKNKIRSKKHKGGHHELYIFPLIGFYSYINRFKKSKKHRKRKNKKYTKKKNKNI